MRYDENYLTDSSGRVLIKSFCSTAPVGKRGYREHHHTECELSAVLEGSGTYAVNDREYDFRGGDVFMFSGDEVHCITDIKTEFRVLNIHFDPRVLWSNTEDLTALKILFARSDSYENKIDRQNPQTRIIYEKINSLARELAEKREGYSTMARYRLFDMLISIVRNYGYIDDNAECTGLPGAIPLMELALRYINDNLSKPLTLDEIAEKAALSPAYFSGVFKKLNGVSPWEYITIKRVEKAIHLLKTTDATKLDIAMECGFNSSSNFYKAFYKVTGKKPGHYAKMRK